MYIFIALICRPYKMCAKSYYFVRFDFNQSKIRVNVHRSNFKTQLHAC